MHVVLMKKSAKATTKRRNDEHSVSKSGRRQRDHRNHGGDTGNMRLMNTRSETTFEDADDLPQHLRHILPRSCWRYFGC